MFTLLQFVNHLIYMFIWFNSKLFLERKGDVVFSVTSMCTRPANKHIELHYCHPESESPYVTNTNKQTNVN